MENERGHDMNDDNFSITTEQLDAGMNKIAADLDEQARLNGVLPRRTREDRFFGLARKIGRASLDGNNDPEFACQECERKFRTVAAARRASLNGCPKCGGLDIEVA